MEKAEQIIEHKSVISIMLPTRGRTGGALEDSLKSLLDNATNPQSIEIMLGVDEDDQDTIDWVNNKAADFC